MMKRTLWQSLAILLLTLSAATAAPYPFDGKVTIDAPPGYTPLSAEEIAIKFPAGNGPQQVLGNAARNTTIAYKTTQLPPTKPEDMPKALPLVQGMLQKAQPSLNFITSEVKTIHGRPWLFYEFEAQAMDTGIHNLMLLTPATNGWVGLNFNSTQKQYPAEKDALAQAIASVQLTP